MRFLFAIFFLILACKAFGQDVIIRITGDSLHVKVGSSNDSFVYYHSSKTPRGQTDVISRKEISEIIYSYEEPNFQLTRNIKREKRDYKIMELWFVYGPSFMPNAEIPEDKFKEYYEELQSGLGFGAGANYYFNKTIGIGAVYSSSKFNNSVNISLTNAGVGGSVAYGNLSNDILLRYFSGGIALRIAIGRGSSNFSMQAGSGVVLFSDNSELVYDYNIEASGIGLHFNGALNIGLGGGLYIPICLAFNGGFVSDFTFTPGKKMPQDLRNELEGLYNNAEAASISHLSLRAGISFAF